LFAAQRSSDLSEGAATAARAIDSGKAAQLCDRLVEVSNAL
jgi:anthranilate phosphoribosyltransferase